MFSKCFQVMPMSTANNVTVAPVIREQCWKEDGTNFVRLRITFNRRSRYITTNLLAREEQVTRSGKIKDPDLQFRMNKLAKEVQDILSQLDSNSLQTMSFDQIMAFIQKKDEEEKPFSLDFFTFAEEIVGGKKGQSQKTYRCAVKSFKAFVKKESMDISEISSALMRSWEAELQKKYGKNARAVSCYTACISFIHGQARLKYNDEESGAINIRNPFQFYKPPRQRPARHRDADYSLIQQMLNLRKDLKSRERLGVDVFLISFALMGMNSPDLYSCSAPQKDILRYNRTKTRDRRDDNAEMFVQIDPLVKDLLAEYRSTDREFAFNFHEKYSCYSVFGANVNIGLKKFCDRIGYPEKVTLYWARHTWASTAYEIGISKSLINDGLCHVDRDMKVTDIYINKDWSLLWEANHKVLSQFKWSDNQNLSESKKDSEVTKKRMTSKQIILSRPGLVASRRVSGF